MNETNVDDIKDYLIDAIFARNDNVVFSSIPYPSPSMVPAKKTWTTKGVGRVSSEFKPLANLLNRLLASNGVVVRHVPTLDVLGETVFDDDIVIRIRPVKMFANDGDYLATMAHELGHVLYEKTQKKKFKGFFRTVFRDDRDIPVGKRILNNLPGHFEEIVAEMFAWKICRPHVSGETVANQTAYLRDRYASVLCLGVKKHEARKLFEKAFVRTAKMIANRG